MQLSAYFTRFSGRGRRVANPIKWIRMIIIFRICQSKISLQDEQHLPSSYALAATLAAIFAEIFLMLEKGG